MPMKLIELFVAFVITTCAFQIRGADDAWPPLPKSSLTITNLGPRPGVKSAKTDSSEVRRAGQRIASITRVDRNGDGRWEEFVFTAFVEKQRVVAITRIGGTNESQTVEATEPREPSWIIKAGDYQIGVGFHAHPRPP
jgi:hypothetical protein